MQKKAKRCVHLQIDKKGSGMVNQLRQMWRLLVRWAAGLFLLTGMIILFASPVEAGIGAIAEYNLDSSSWPEYIAAGPDGNLWFTDKDYMTPAIGKVNSATGEITRYSTGLNSGSAPDYIVAGPDGNLWFTDWGSTKAIGRIDPSTGVITEYSTGLNSGSWPNYIAAGPDGNLWFTDNGSIKAIGRIDPATGAITEYSTGLIGSDLCILVTGPDGNLWFTDCGSTRAIGKIDPATGTITKYSTGLNSSSILTVIAAGPDGNLWFTDGGTPRAIGKVNPSTGAITEYTAGLTSSNLPNYIVAGPDGNLWFTDNGSNKAIGKIDPSTGTITEYSTGSGSGNLYNIVAGPDSSLWVSDYGTSTIYRVNSTTGAVTAYPTDVFSWGLPTFFLAAGPDGNLWFTDSCTPSIGKVYAVVPAVTAVSPAGGPATGGTTVTLTGSGFTGATAVNFGSVAAGSFTVNSATSITAISPVHEAGTVDVTVNTPGGTSATDSAGQFTYTSPPITTGTIIGTVKNSNNNPVPEATVSLTVSESVYSAQTAADGTYSMLNIPAGTDYTVIASKAGFQDRIVPGVTVTAGSTTAGVDFILYTAVEDSGISPTSATFDKNSANTGAEHYADIPVTITFNGNTLLSIMNGIIPLVVNTDYTVSGSVYSISKTYLAGQSFGTTTLTFNFSAGSSQSLTVTIGDSTPTTHTVSVSANPPASGLVSGGGIYEEGASVIVTATPNSGYSFVNWTEGGVQVSTGISYAFMLDTSDRNLVANFIETATSTAVVLQSAMADGTTDTMTSTKIDLTFDTAITGLTADDLTITNGTGAGVKGALTGSGTSWSIALTSVTTQGNVTVAVTAPAGYTLTGSPKTVAVYKAAEIINSTISPTTVVFDLDHPDAVSTTITWSSAHTVTDVVYGTIPVAFTLSGTTLTISAAWLTGLNLSENGTAELEISFDVGNSATLIVEAVRNHIPGNNALLSDLTVCGSTVSGFAAGQYEYNVELPYGTQPGSATARVEATTADLLATKIVVQATQLPGDATVTVTSEDTNATQTYTIHFSLAAPPDTVVNIAAIQGVTAPIRGAVPVKTITETVQYTGAVSWNPANNPFAASTVYTATIILTPKAGYTLTGVDANFFMVTGANSASNLANSGVITATFPATEASQSNNNGGSGGGGNSTASILPVTPTYTADVKATDTAGNGVLETTLPVAVNTNTGSAALVIGSQQGNIIISGGTTVITVPSIPGVTAYTLGIPATYLSSFDGKGTLTFNTDTGSITLPADMLPGIAGTGGKKAEITIGQGDKSSLSDAAKATVGNRPLIQLAVTIDGKQTDWNNLNAPVTITIPYTPTASELANPESIVIWYIDSNGNAVSVPNGHYDMVTGAVIFATTHFSYYAVGYSNVSFNDVATGAWYNKAVRFIAARGITTGTGNGNYSPDAKLTRGQFIVMLMKAYNIASDVNSKDNFSDAGNTYYTGYLAAAKRLGISAGVGNNMYAPGKQITRQEMFTLLYNALKVIGQLPQGGSGKTLDHFIDAGQINSWAKEAMTLLVKTGTVGGSAGKLTPLNTTTRAEMAQVLYNLLSK